MSSQSILLKVHIMSLDGKGHLFYFKASNYEDYLRLVQKMERIRQDQFGESQNDVHKVFWEDDEGAQILMGCHDADDFAALHEYAVRKGNLYHYLHSHHILLDAKVNEIELVLAGATLAKEQ